MKRFFLDSNVYDEFLKSHELLGLVLKAQSQSLIELIGTHLEKDELSATVSRNPEKGFLLLSAHQELKILKVPTEGFVIDKSRLGAAELFANADIELFISLTADNPDHVEDVLMILAAKRERATFVTQEKRIPSLCVEIGVECINSQDLGEWCYQNIS